MKNTRNLFLIGAISTSLITTALPINAFTIFQGADGPAPGDPPNFTLPDQAFDNFIGAGSTTSATEDFEGIPADTIDPTLMFGDITATLSGGSDVNDAPFNAAFNTTRPSGQNYLFGTILPGQTDNFRIDFSEPIQGLGFYSTDIGDFSGVLSVVGSLGGIEVFSEEPSVIPTNGNLLFWGIQGASGETFDSVQLIVQGSTGPGDSFGFDDLTIFGTEDIIEPPTGTTPEPGTLIGLGVLATVGFVSRRRKDK